MVGIYCCVENCWEPHGGQCSKHRFPNPAKYMTLFQKWVQICQNKRLHEDGVTPQKIYSNFRVCRCHFSEDDFFGDKLKNTSFPHINVPMQKSAEQENPSPPGNTIAQHDPLETVLSVPSTSSKKDEPNELQNTRPRTTSEGLLSEVEATRSVNLTPRAKHLYHRASYFKRRAQLATKSKISLRKRLEEASKFTKSDIFEKVTSSLDQIRSRFFEMQLSNNSKCPKGRRYTIDDKVLALALFKQCGSGYKLLSKIFTLPSQKTVIRLLNRIPIEPGLCEGIFDVLKLEAKNFKDSRDKFCFLLFDEMSLKPGLTWNHMSGDVEGFEDFGYKRTSNIADHVQVFMLRGIKKNWKQPVFYNFVEGATKWADIANIIKLIVRKCRESGLEIVATVCDQGTNNVAAINSLISDTKAKYGRLNIQFNSYHYEIDDKKIIPLFDSPHLLKGIRNNFLKYNVEFKSGDQIKTAKWDHIIMAYKMDPHLGSLRLMPKLTENHVYPVGRNKMRVSYCTQVFSRTVAAAMNLMGYSETEIITEEGSVKMRKEAMSTAAFLEFMDNLFDSVNGMSRQSNPMKPLKGPVNDTSQHFEFWDTAIKKLSSMKFIKPDGASFVPPSVKNFIKTLRNFKELYKSLKDLGFVYMLPRMFNQDPLENFFGRIRQRGARYNTPTAAAFTPFFKSLLVKDFTSSHSVRSNCEEDDSEMFITLKNFLTQGISEELEENEFQDLSCYPRTPSKLEILEQQALKYVCGYLLKSAKSKFQGCSCAGIILGKKDATDSTDEFTKLKEFKNCHLRYVSDFFFFEMCKALSIIKYILRSFTYKKHVFRKIFKILMKDINFTDCSHNDIIKKIIFDKFLKTVGHNFLNQLNRVLDGQDKRIIPENSPTIFKKCRNKYIKSMKRQNTKRM